MKSAKIHDKSATVNSSASNGGVSPRVMIMTWLSTSAYVIAILFFSFFLPPLVQPRPQGPPREKLPTKAFHAEGPGDEVSGGVGVGSLYGLFFISKLRRPSGFQDAKPPTCQMAFSLGRYFSVFWPTTKNSLFMWSVSLCDHSNT